MWDLAGELAWLLAMGAVGVYALVTARGFTTHQPGPAGPDLFPFWSGLLLVVISLYCAVHASAELIRKRAALHARPAILTADNVRWVIIVGALFLYVYALNHVGLVEASLALAVVLAATVQRWRTRLVIVALAAALSIGIALLFEQVLYLPVP